MTTITRTRQEQRGDHSMSTTNARLRAASVALAPAALLAGFVYHPYISNPIDEAAVAEALVSDTTRWGISHLLVAVGSGLAALAFLALRGYLRDAGEERRSVVALPLVVMGSTLFALLPAMEIGALSAVEAGGDAETAQSELRPWFLPVLLAGGIAFALGVCFFAAGIARSRVLGVNPTRLVVGALVVMAAARFVPLGAALYVSGVAGIVALWPLAYEMWRHPEIERTAGQPRPMPAT